MTRKRSGPAFEGFQGPNYTMVPNELFDEFADYPARWVAHGLTLDFAVQHRASHEFCREPRCVTDLHPARGFSTDRKVPNVLLILDRTGPDEFAVVSPSLDVDLEAHGLRQANAFQAMHLRTDHKHILQ